MEVDENPLAYVPEAELRGRLGTIIQGPLGTYPHPELNAAIPATFDARTVWGIDIHPILNQAQCGSCWAFGATESLSDRFAIATKGKTNVVLSPQDLVACDTSNYGCQGGYLNLAWDFLVNQGAVTMACEPYTSGGGSVAPCLSSCVNGAPFHKYKCQPGTIVEMTNVEEI
jgi:cathepsin B